MIIQPVILTTPQRRNDRVATIAAAFTDRRYAPPIIHCDEAGRGAAAATRDALRRAGESMVLFLEDDLFVDAQAAARVAEVTFPEDVAVISFCDMREVPEFSPDGLYPRSPLGSDGLGWWGNQALLIHPDTLRVLRDVDWFGADVEDALGVRVHKLTYGDEGRNCSDIRLALLVHRHGGKRRMYAVNVPSVFKHVGYQSMCFPGRGMGERETRNWIGDRRRFGLS